MHSIKSRLYLFGNYVVLKHNYKKLDGGTVELYSRYSHLTSVNVSVGATVSKGATVGTIGSTGSSQGFHLDFQILYGNWKPYKTYSIDPYSNQLLELPSNLVVYDSWDCGKSYYNLICALYATPLSCTITFNANGGSCSTGTKTITPGSAIGTLPTASKSDHDFAGWSMSSNSASDPVTASTTFSENTTLYAHYADRLYTGNKITFDANGGTLPGEKAHTTLNGFNIYRNEDYLVVYNCGGETVETNYYGAEVAVDATGCAVKIRSYGNTEQLTVPDGGFVLSGHSGGTASVFVYGIEIGDYVAYDQENRTVYVYDSEEAYHTYHKYIDSNDVYGTLPTPTGSDDFRGWFTHPEEGEQVTENSTYIASKLYAHWGCTHDFAEEIIPATCEDYEKICYTCKDCGYSYTEYTAEAFTEWSTTKPTGVDESLIETKTEYRYRDYETTTSYEPDLSGWTKIGSSWQQSGSGDIQYVKSWPSGFSRNNSLYTQYNKSPKSASETATDKTEINSDQVTGYLYYHWCRGTYTDYCFSGSTGIKTIDFQGDAPTIGGGAFNKITATAFYPGDNTTWTTAKMQNYGGKITWEAN